MKSLLYISGAILIGGWVLGIFIYGIVPLIYLLLLLAIASLLLGILKKA
jgi:hypothetical protein